MHSLFSSQKIILLLLTIICYKSSIISSAPNCSQNSINEDYVTCINVNNINDLHSVWQKNWNKLKIYNDYLNQFEWDAISGDFTNLADVDLSKSGQLIIPENGFDNIPNVQILNVSKCEIESLPSIFINRRSVLKNLDASWNLFEKLIFDKNKLKSLEVANFSHNNIRFINGALIKLKILHLDFNEFKSITLNGYSNLNVLTISENLIEKLTMDSFQNLPSMEELIMTSSPLGRIEDRTFESMTELKNLNLSNNNIKRLSSAVFIGLNNLIQLDLNLNNIRELADFQFQHLVKMQYLDLSRNSIKILRSSHFINLTDLRRLYININDIEEIQSNTFSNLYSLEILDISNNLLEHLKADIFGPDLLPRLRKLMLKSNHLKYIHPLAFSSIPFIEYLSLGFNQLRSLDIRMFAPMRHLQKFHLGNNLIEEIAPEILECFTDIRELLLDNNRLSYLSYSNANLTKLTKISLEGNPWQCPCWEEILYWLHTCGVSYVRPQSLHFKGQRPLCVVTPVKFCVKNLQSIRKYEVEDIYNSGYKWS